MGPASGSIIIILNVVASVDVAVYPEAVVDAASEELDVESYEEPELVVVVPDDWVDSDEDDTGAAISES